MKEEKDTMNKIEEAIRDLKEVVWDEGHAAYCTPRANPYRRQRLGEEPQQVNPPVFWGGGGGGCAGGSGGSVIDLETLKQNRDFWMNRSDHFEQMHKSVEQEKNRMIDEVNKWKDDRNLWHKMYVELHDKVNSLQSAIRDLLYLK